MTARDLDINIIHAREDTEKIRKSQNRRIIEFRSY